MKKSELPLIEVDPMYIGKWRLRFWNTTWISPLSLETTTDPALRSGPPSTIVAGVCDPEFAVVIYSDPGRSAELPLAGSRATELGEENAVPVEHLDAVV
jgi:hypothetical protein